MIVCAASNNAGKLKELRRILERMGHEVKSLRELGITLDPEETGTTFAENARIKAEAFCKASGLPTVADDSGLCTNALNGAPGTTAMTMPTTKSCCARWPMCRKGSAAQGLCPPSALCCRTAVRSRSRASARDALRSAYRMGITALAMTRCSSPMHTARPMAAAPTPRAAAMPS